MELIPINKGNLVIRGYDTDKDEKRAVKDINRLLTILSGMSMSEINKMLEPYRVRVAKTIDKELQDKQCVWEREEMYETTRFRCSQCKNVFEDDAVDEDLIYKFCPFCGCKIAKEITVKKWGEE